MKLRLFSLKKNDLGNFKKILNHSISGFGVSKKWQKLSSANKKKFSLIGRNVFFKIDDKAKSIDSNGFDYFFLNNFHFKENLYEKIKFKIYRFISILLQVEFKKDYRFFNKKKYFNFYIDENRKFFEKKNIKKIKSFFDSHSNIFKDYYKQFLICLYILKFTKNFKKDIVICDIGSGSAIISIILNKIMKKSTYIIVDLPSTLSYGYLMACKYAPNSKKIFLNKINNLKYEIKKNEFLFIPNSLFFRLDKRFIDVVICTEFFQEMTVKDTKRYFNKIRKIIKSENLFINHNRVHADDRNGQKLTSMADCDYQVKDKHIYSKISKMYLSNVNSHYLKISRLKIND